MIRTSTNCANDSMRPTLQPTLESRIWNLKVPGLGAISDPTFLKTAESTFWI